MPRTCSIWRAVPTAGAVALLAGDRAARNLVRLFRIMCEKGRSDAAPGSARRDMEGRSWRRAPGAPRTVRSENMIAVVGSFRDRFVLRRSASVIVFRCPELRVWARRGFAVLPGFPRWEDYCRRSFCIADAESAPTLIGGSHRTPVLALRNLD